MKYMLLFLIAILLAGCASPQNFSRPAKSSEECVSCSQQSGSADLSPVFDD